MKFFKIGIVTIVLSVIIVWFAIKDALHPMQRTEITHPIYTIGDANYQLALSEGKNVVKFGKMFWGLYPGGLAFATPDDALAYMHSNQQMLEKFSSGWAVYELSGDMLEDTNFKGDQRYLNKSLLVVKLSLKP